MTAIRAAAAVLVFCGVALPATAQNTRPAPSNVSPGLLALPPANAIPGTLDLATGQFTPLTANTTRPTVINEVFTFTPDFSKIGSEAAIIRTITCTLYVLPYFQGGYARATNQFDLENPPTTLSVHVFFTAYVDNPMMSVQRYCTALDENNETHYFSATTSILPVGDLDTHYTDAVIF